MKFNSLSLAALAATGAFATSAYAGDADLPNVYGRVDVSVNSTEIAGADAAINTNSNKSRLGVQNTHALSDDLAVFYRLEFEVNIDERLRSTDKGMLRQRNSVVGLKGNWGKVFVGVNDTPMKKAELKLDLFSDYYGADFEEVLRGQDRISDTISYVSPTMAGFTGWLMLVPGDDASGAPGEDSGGGADGASGDGIADGISASVTYKTKLMNEPLHVAVAYNSDIKGLDIIRASAQYSYGAFTFGGLVQKAEKSEGDSLDGLGVLASVAFDLTSADKLKLQIATSDVDSEETSPGSDQWTFGWDHKLAKSTKLYAYYSDRSNDLQSEEFSTVGVGIQHNFGKK